MSKRRETKPERRVPPPDDTGCEEQHLRRLKNGKQAVMLRLRNGNRIDGLIVDFDRRAIQLAPADGAPLWIPRSDVRYLSEVVVSERDS